VYGEVYGAMKGCEYGCEFGSEGVLIVEELVCSMNVAHVVVISSSSYVLVGKEVNELYV
jgi:hypothetical protein